MKTDIEFKLALAELLPEKIIVQEHGTSKNWFCFWNESPTYSTLIKDTEWLHVCWLIERGMGVGSCIQFEMLLQNTVIKQSPTKDWRAYSASWQQRAEVLLKVKGIN